MKKLALLMAVLMLAVAAFTVSAFDDVNVNDDCFDAVNTLVALDVIKGKSETTFAPDDAVTREQMAALVTRLYTTINFENGANDTPFTDLDDPYYNQVITWCYQEGVINGTSPSTFDPKAHITYQDGITMAARLIGYTDLTYPLGYITKGHQIGLCDDLDIDYEKELTRGEVAILLYNALEAEGNEVIKTNVPVEGGYYIPVERNFKISTDVYKFKNETYQIVATDNYNLNGFTQVTDTQYRLALVDEDGNYVEGEDNQGVFEFEALGLAEDTDGDANILGYLDIIYRGDSLNDKKAVILSAVVNSDLNADADIAVYYEKEGKNLVAKQDQIVVNGKVVDAADVMYTIDGNGIITKFGSEDTLAEFAPVFFQADSKAEGLYEQKVVDLDKDGIPEYVIILPYSMYEVTGLSNKGIYTLTNMATGEDIDNVDDWKLVLNADVEKDDFVLAYTWGPVTVVEEVVEPVITTVTKKSGANANTAKYTLATGDVVTLASENLPLLGAVEFTVPSPSTNEVALYIVNGKIVHTENVVVTSYTPYSYAFFVDQGEPEKTFDPETGKTTYVDTAIVFMDGGKAATIPVKVDANDTFYTNAVPGVITIKAVTDGVYDIDAGMLSANAEYEVVLDQGDLFLYEGNTGVFKYKDVSADMAYVVDLDENSEFYEVTREGGNYKSNKRYTMADMPKTEYVLDGAVIRVTENAAGKVISRTLVVAESDERKDATTPVTDPAGYDTYRIVLNSEEIATADGKLFFVYSVLNPVTGAVEEYTDEVTAGAVAHPVSTLVRKNVNGDVVVIPNANAVFQGWNLANGEEVRKYMQIAGVIKNFANVYRGAEADLVLNGITSTDLIFNGVKVVVLDIDDVTGEYIIDITNDYSVLEGKVVRTYTDSANGYVALYVVVVPYEWAQEAGFTVLNAYSEYVETLA